MLCFLRCVQLFRKKKVQPNTVLDVPIPPPVQICNLPGCGEPETAPTPAEFWNRMLKSAGLGVRRTANNRRGSYCCKPTPQILSSRLPPRCQARFSSERLRDVAQMIQLAGSLQSKIKAPALIPTGSAADTVVPPQMFADLLELTPSKKHIELPGPTDATYFEAPDFCIEHIAKLPEILP